MSRNNDVFKVLVTSGNQAVLAAGSGPDALAIGQIGVFDADTGVSVDATSTPKEFYLAVGVDDDGDAVMDNIEKSAGQKIQRLNTRFYSFRPHTAPQPMIVDVTGYENAKCDDDYTLRLEFRNQEIYRRQGFNQYTKPYAFRTPCCAGDATEVDGNEITKLLVEAINADVDGLVTAVAVARQALTAVTHGVAADLAEGDEVSDADMDAIIAYNAANAGSEVYTDTRITTIPVAINKFCSVNLKYYHPRQTVIIPSLVTGFGCIGSTEIVQEAAMEEGNGYDVQQKEYKSSGWNGTGPYVLSEATGTAKYVEYRADKAVKYDQVIVEYDQFSVGGWQEYLNNLSTIVAVPATDTATRDGLVAVLDAFLTPLGFDALADDAALADTDPAVVEPTTDIDDTDGDGLA